MQLVSFILRSNKIEKMMRMFIWSVVQNDKYQRFICFRLYCTEIVNAQKDIECEFLEKFIRYIHVLLFRQVLRKNIIKILALKTKAS